MDLHLSLTSNKKGHRERLTTQLKIKKAIQTPCN